MGDPYSELVRAEKLINLTLQSEEDKFLSTLSRGLKILEEEAKNLDSGDIFDGKTAFKLYDTYGFPIDLTEDLLRDKGLLLDKDQFDISMKKQKDDAKKSWLGSGEKKTDEIWFEVLDINLAFITGEHDPYFLASMISSSSKSAGKKDLSQS